MKLLSLSMLFVLLLGCGAKSIDVKVLVTDPNNKPLAAEGVLEYRTQQQMLHFTDGVYRHPCFYSALAWLHILSF